MSPRVCSGPPSIAGPSRPVISQHVLPLFNLSDSPVVSSSCNTGLVSSSLFSSPAPISAKAPIPFSWSVPVPSAPFFPSTLLVSPLSSLPYNLVPSPIHALDNVSLLSPNNISPSPEVASVLCPSSHPISPIDQSSAHYCESDPEGVSDDESNFESTCANPPTTLGSFFTSLSGDSF